MKLLSKLILISACSWVVSGPAVALCIPSVCKPPPNPPTPTTQWWATCSTLMAAGLPCQRSNTGQLLKMFAPSVAPAAVPYIVPAFNPGAYSSTGWGTTGAQIDANFPGVVAANFASNPNMVAMLSNMGPVTLARLSVELQRLDSGSVYTKKILESAISRGAALADLYRLESAFGPTVVLSLPFPGSSNLNINTTYASLVAMGTPAPLANSAYWEQQTGVQMSYPDAGIAWPYHVYLDAFTAQGVTQNTSYGAVDPMTAALNQTGRYIQVHVKDDVIGIIIKSAQETLAILVKAISNLINPPCCGPQTDPLPWVVQPDPNDQGSPSFQGPPSPPDPNAPQPEQQGPPAPPPSIQGCFSNDDGTQSC